MNPKCSNQYFQRDSTQYQEIVLNDHQRSVDPQSIHLKPFHSWPFWFNQSRSALLMFQFYLPFRIRLALIGNHNEPPSMIMHSFFKIISDDNHYLQQQQQLENQFDHLHHYTNHHHHSRYPNLPIRVKSSSPLLTSTHSNHQHHHQTIKSIHKRESGDDLILIEFKHLFEQGQWYLTLINDMDLSVSIIVNISMISTNHSQHCPNDCHSRGYCHHGSCQCFPGFLGPDCLDSESSIEIVGVDSFY